MATKTKNRFQKKIDLYEGFIRDKKIGPMSVPAYEKYIQTAKRLMKLLAEDRMTPTIFFNLSDGDRWGVASELRGVIWLCGTCRAEQGEETPTSMFMGERYCSTCDSLLTERTNGGQSNPFNYRFKYKNKL